MACRGNNTWRTIFTKRNRLWDVTTRRQSWLLGVFYEHQLGVVLILDEATNIIVKDKILLVG